jgi:hypothetical protein
MHKKNVAGVLAEHIYKKNYGNFITDDFISGTVLGTFTKSLTDGHAAAVVITLFLSASPVFVPSLSWQNDHF